MSQEPLAPPMEETVAELQERVAELMCDNGHLRANLQRVQADCLELQRRLRELTIDSSVERERRRAALNLMEDAMKARLAEQRENAERRRAEEELRDANARKDEFLATLAHELRNPLAPIRNSLHLLRIAGADAGAIDRVHEMLERQVSHMVRLVDDLMEVSRITRGKIELRKELVEFAAIVRSAVETSKPLIETCEHQLAISLPAEPLMLHADPMRLAQVLTNLLNNAAKFTERGGQIWLTGRRDGSHLVVSVRDNGIGIPVDMLPKVFDLFTQIDRTPGRVQGDLGIGLTLARTLVVSHGGTIEARSQGMDEGTEFVLRLPLETTKTAYSSGSGQCATPADIHRHRILVVDDNRDAADSLAMLLTHLGADVQTVNDGQAALKEFQSFRPSVILLDIGMPGLDGNEVARRVRRLPDGRNVILIALTGWGQDKDRQKSHEAGFDFHLVKPVELSELQSLLGSISNAPKPA